ncbi:MAG: tetratricopeptide repeat protein [Polyangiales bacterium]
MRGAPLDQRLRDRAPPPEDGGEATLQLAIGREGVGLELSKPVELGPVTLQHARSRLVGLGFPLDVSGGVERFRHRRTTLEEVGLTIDHGPAERWLSSITEGLVSGGPAEARIGWSPPPDVGTGESPWEREEHVVWSSGNLRFELATDRSVCAFDMAIAPFGGGLVGIAHRVRALGTPRSPTAIVGSLLGRMARALEGESNGLRLVLSDPVKAVVLSAFVVRGARVPTREELVVTELRPEVERFRMGLRRAEVPSAPSSLFVALHELDRLLEGADAALVANDLDRARELYVRALDRAPRHRAILTRLAELDAFTGERTEAALSWLREAQRGRGRRGLDGNDLGRTLLAAMLAERTRAFGRARAAWERAGNWAFDRGESRLASRAWARAATVATDDDPQLPSLLDRALSADPAETESRWRRVRLALSFGDDARAMEDVQHLEAQAKGRARRLQTLMRAGEIFRDAGRLDRAVPAWERALRHAPDDARVLAGLGSALLSGGETARAISLLSRAISAPGDPEGRSAIVLDLSRALADGIGDVPAAISRLREIGPDDARAAHARALEAAYRLRVGDRVGAEHAYASAAEAVERRGVHTDEARVVAELLAGGAKVVQLEHESELAMRLAMGALSILPNDPEMQTLVRELGRSVGARARVAEDEAPEPKTDPGLVEGTSLAIDLEDEEPSSPPDQEARAEALLARVKANPDDEEAIDALVDLLGRLGRDFELFALLQGRWEDATTEERAAMVPRQRSVLERMAKRAEERGATIEAQLYLDAAAALGA